MIREVKTENGYVRGIEAADPRITAFKGIPFAAPPVGENRWRAPQPCPDWEGVREAYRFAPISVQDTPGLGDDIYCREWHVDPDIAMSEDCLYLNVWTGAKDDSERRPVVIWYFGGGLQWGYPAEMEFDGERIARRGVVVVTVNYRLNVFGFLAHPELTAQQPDAPSNFGNLDQQAGLKWVIRNIANFGGDPKCITIAGQSAGGGSVMAQLACPGNTGLFQRAIIQSGMIRNPYYPDNFGAPEPLASAEKNGEDFFAFLGVSSLAEARKLDAFHILAKYGEFAQTHPRMLSVLDNCFYVGDPYALIAEGRCVDAEIMAGNTSDEFASVIFASSESALRAEAEKIFGDQAEEFLAQKEARECGEGCYAKVCSVEPTVKALALRRQAIGKQTYYYCFDVDIPGWDHPGNFHSVELWFFFETLAKCWRPYHGQHYDIARKMCNYWCNFVKTGDPNGEDADGTAMPEWKPYTGETPFGMIFKTEGPQPQNPAKESPFMAMLIRRMLSRLEEGEE